MSDEERTGELVALVCPLCSSVRLAIRGLEPKRCDVVVDFSLFSSSLIRCDGLLQAAGALALTPTMSAPVGEPEGSGE